MLVKIKEIKEVEEVETDVGVIRKTKKGIVIENKDMALYIEGEDDGTYTVYLDIMHWRTGHDHNDKIYIKISGIPAETNEPHPIYGGVYKVGRVVKIEIDGDLVEVKGGG